MARRSGLGKGLGALIPTRGRPRARRAAACRSSRSASIEPEPAPAPGPLRRGGAGRARPRRSARSACSSRCWSGRVGDGAYELIAGERRWRAAKRAGLQTIPALVRDDRRRSASLEQALVENLHREDLNPLEEAAAYQQLIEDFGLTHDEVASRVGKSRVAVTNTLRLFQLPPAIQQLVADGQLSAGPRPGPARHPRPRVPGAARPAGRRRGPVGARGRGGGPGTRRPAAARRPRATDDPRPRLRPPGLLELEELLSEHLDTRVKVDDGTRARQGRDRVRHPRGPRADLPAHDAGPRADEEPSDPRSVGEA